MVLEFLQLHVVELDFFFFLIFTPKIAQYLGFFEVIEKFGQQIVLNLVYIES